MIDENLSPELANVVAARGFRAHAVTRDKKLRGRGDSVIARYAIDNDLILVTNNAVDFERIYIRTECHPGLIFISSESSKLRKKSIQIAMMEEALEEVLSDCLCQEAVNVTARFDGTEVVLEIERFYLPELATSEAVA